MPPQPPNPTRTLWLLVLLALALLAVSATLALLGVLGGPRPELTPRAVLSTSADVPRDPTRLELAGSGSNLPLTRRLVAAFNAQLGRTDARVHESIGSGGGVQALLDGVIDVGLISRPLSERERDLGVHALPYARVPVVVAAHAGVPDASLSARELVALYAGRQVTGLGGTPLVVLQRERGDSSHRVFAEALPGFAAADEAARRARRFEVLYSDRDMQEALLSVENAVGLFDLGAIRSQALPLAVLSVDGVAPTPENVASGRYAFVKELAFAYVEPLTPLAAELVAFVRSEAGQRVVLDSGYLRPAGGSDE